VSAERNFRQSEFRERVTEAIFEMLADLPETQRNMFVWNHYRGYQPGQIAEILRCSPSEVEATLDGINSILYRRTRSLLKEDPQLDAGTDLPRDVTPQGATPSPSLDAARAAELWRVRAT
jgi:Sigma-70, region 4